MKIKQTSVAPGITLSGSKINKYRARKVINGERVSFYTNNLLKAKKWLKNIE